MKPERFQYVPDGLELTKFFLDRSPVTIIQGPIGSGTSTACCHKMWAISLEQRADKQGVRRTRWLVVRNTYSDLKGTTLKTWRFWFEEIAQGLFGEVKMTNPPNHHIKTRLPDGTMVDAEFVFLALDMEEDVRKLVSLECTGIFFNEMQFTDKTIFDTAHSRAMQGRYPPKLAGGPSWKGVIGDLNAPPEGHWIPYMRGDVPMPDEWDDEERKQYVKPDDWNFYVQPPGLLEKIENGKIVGYEENPAAENMKWVDESYLALIKGKPKSWIDTFVMNRVGLYRAGKPVFETFRREIHVSMTSIEYQPEWPLIIGLDFARNPAAAICQMIRGVMYILDEFGMENVSAGDFAPMLRQRIMRKFPGALTTKTHDLEALKKRMGSTVAVERHIAQENAKQARSKIQFFGDPTGGSRGQATDWTPFIIMSAHGMTTIPAPGGNKLSVRLEAVSSLLSKMVSGTPALQVSPDCIYIKNGMDGGYHFAKIKGQHRHHDEPMKDRYSDYCDAVQYAALGAGVGFSALAPSSGKPNPQKVRKKPYSLKRRQRT